MSNENQNDPASMNEPPADWQPGQDAGGEAPGTAVATQERPTNIAAAPIDELQAIDNAIAACSGVLANAAGTFSYAMRLAEGISTIRSLMTNEMMAKIMPLMNTRLGFKTDKDPTRYSKKLNGYEKPYPMSTVREVLIEATLRGAYPVNNEFNIISSGPYLTKEFYRRNVKEFPGLTDLQETYSIPRTVGKSLVVDATASWKLHGVPQSLERTGNNAIVINADEWSSADQTLGKAERKLLFAVHRRLTGSESSTKIDPNDPDVMDATFRRDAATQDIDDVQRHPEDNGRQESPANDYQQAPVNPDSPAAAVDPWAAIEARYMQCLSTKDVAQLTAKIKSERPSWSQAELAKLNLANQVHQKRVKGGGK